MNQRDELAMERTQLGNLRTFLATVRTAIALLGLGAGLWKLFEHGFFHTLAIISLVISVFTFIYGLKAFRKTQKRLLNTPLSQ